MLKLSVAAAAVMSLSVPAFGQSWHVQQLDIPTRWTATVNPDAPLPEYPRPQLVRRDWRNLNGLWSYAITPMKAAPPTSYDGSILVPYPVESALSGVARALKPDEALWYKRTLSVPTGSGKTLTLLHFGAVDNETTVYVNGRPVGGHVGGYQSFTVDISDALRAGDNDLVVKVVDPTDAGFSPHGKQVLKPQDVFYTATSGIWQTVWMETVPKTYIGNVETSSDIDTGTLRVNVSVDGASAAYSLRTTVLDGTAVVAQGEMRGARAFKIDHPRLWSPDDPFLYDIQVQLIKDGAVIDEVKSYAGLRKIEIRKDAKGASRIFLNGQYTYNLGVLNQGFWPDGLYTAPTDDALKFDVEAIKAMGFNTIRMHEKVEADRWYYYCDTLGMLVWQDMPEPAQNTLEAQREFTKEMQENIQQLRAHPSIVTWVLFNEGSHAFDQVRLASMIRSLDSSRLINADSGPNVRYLSEWERSLAPKKMAKLISGEEAASAGGMLYFGFYEPGNWTGGDMADVHLYPGPALAPTDGGRARVLGEFGGISVPVKDHDWTKAPVWGYGNSSAVDLSDVYARMVEKLQALEQEGLTASIYTQPFDVEQEQNGLMTYDRTIIKIPIEELARINGRMVPRTRNYAKATRGFSAGTASMPVDDEHYREMLADYSRGDREPSFLVQLALAAFQKQDATRANEVGNEALERLTQPYPDEVWPLAKQLTHTSRDRGFELLRAHPQKADGVLGQNEAEKLIRTIIGIEEIPTLATAGSSAPDWPVLEKKISEKYGDLGAEKVYGSEMIYYLYQQDWDHFGKSYLRYFSKAKDYSDYPVSDLSYVLSEHVTDSAALKKAASVCHDNLDSTNSPESGDPVDIDTCADLLFKVGHTDDALKLEKRAVRLSGGRDKIIVAHLKKMTRHVDAVSGGLTAQAEPE